MSDVVIRVENLCKEYRLGTISHGTLYRDLQSGWAKFRGKEDPNARIGSVNREQLNSTNDRFCALKDVSFDVRQGEIVGIIGRNGAGKSTLLKIISRVTAPTSGTIKIKGRVASLLEVGTGFHPELTGRENIFLNGAILGMHKGEIEQKFDEIVKFAEIDQFIDTPVKRYSSGMYVRLAFAVAAHLEPEILVVDEVLAVGDAGFQKKCLGKMGDIAKEGRTVLFVSHNMNAIEQLCTKCVCLQDGRLILNSSNVRDVINNYLFSNDNSQKSSEWVNPGNKFINPWFIPSAFYLADENENKIQGSVGNKSDVWIYIEGEIKEIDPSLTIGYAIFDEDGHLLYWSFQTDECEDKWVVLKEGFNVIKSKFPQQLLNQGIYRIECIACLHYRQWLYESGHDSPTIFINIHGQLSDSPIWITRRPGILAPVLQWTKKESINK